MTGGGAERVLISVLRNMDAEKFDVTLLLINGGGVFFEDVPANVEVLCVFPSLGGAWCRAVTHFYGLRHWWWRRRVKALLGNRRFDTIAGFMEGAAAKLHSLVLDRGERNVSWVHINLRLGRWYDFWFRKEEEEAYYKKLDGIAFVSEDAKHVFEGLFDTDAAKTVILNPVEKDVVCRNALSENIGKHDVFTIVNVGRLVEQKRQDRLIRAAVILKGKGYEFIVKILGTGNLEQPLRKLCRELDVEDKVRFEGFVRNPYPVMGNADLFCLTSQTEGYPMVATESLCLGVPMLSTRVTGVTEMLAHGGGMFCGDSPEEIAEALELLMTHPDEIGRLRAETAEASKQFAIDSVIEKIERFLQK